MNHPSKKATSWRLDLLEVKFFNSNPRFSNTKKLLGARNNSKLLKKLPASVDEARKEILAMKTDLFARKYHGAQKKLIKEVSKHASAAALKMKDAHALDAHLLTSQDFIQLLVESKLAKSIISAVLINKDLKITPPPYLSESLRTVVTDKLSPSNPSKFFKDYCQDNKHLNNYISSMWNKKEIKQLLSEIDWAFRSVRGSLTKAERDARAKDTGLGSKPDEYTGVSDSENELNRDGSNERHNWSGGDNSDSESFAQYNDLIGSSDEDDMLDVESEAPSERKMKLPDAKSENAHRKHKKEEEDDFFELEKKHKRHTADDIEQRYNLPEMAVGYYSGGSDVESDYDNENDKVVKEATSQRKNRRGQRARQKIWELKYGKEAKHVKAQQIKIHNEREQKRLEYEERCRKREEKARPSGLNVAPLGERKPHIEGAAAPEKVSAPPSADHPSWEAKRLANEKLKNVKFTGKKITFD